MDVVLLAADLAVISRLQGAVARVGANLRIASSVAKAEETCRGQQPALLIIDLALPNVDLAFVSKLKSHEAKPPHIIAFGPHVQEERLAAAEAVHCDIVLSRGAFWSQVDRLLAGAAN